jgi:hypothetical protein
MLTVAYDEIALADDGSRVRARANCPATPGRFSAGWLLRLALLAPDRVRLAATHDVLRSDRPFVYPLELSRAGMASFGAGASALAPDLPPAVLERVRRGRAAILVWLGHEAIPLELNDAGTVWLFDVIEMFIAQHGLPRGAVWLVTGTVSALDALVEWLGARGLYLPEVVELRALSVFPGFAQATYRANEQGWDVDCAPDGADGAVRAGKVALAPEAFRARTIAVDELAAEHASGALRAKRFLCLNDGVELHRQVIVSALQSAGLLADSLTRFDAAPVELNGRCAFPVPSMPDFQDRVRHGWLALQPALPLRVTDPQPYRASYVSIASAASFAGYPVVDDRLLAPMLNRQLFVWAGPPDTLHILHGLGFRSFARLIDERYDKPDTDSARMLHLIGAIEALGRCPKAALRDLHVAAQPEIEHNHAHLIEGRHQLEVLLRELDARLGTA